MRSRRAKKTVRAIEGNAGVASAYAKVLRREYNHIRDRFIAELLKYVRSDNKKIAFDASLNITGNEGLTGLLGRLLARFIKAARDIFTALAIRFGIKAARATGQAQTEALKKAGIPAGMIREMFRAPAPAPAPADLPAQVQGTVAEPNRQGFIVKSGQDITGFVPSPTGTQAVYRTDAELSLKIGGGYMSDRARAALPQIIQDNTELITRMCARDLGRLQEAAAEGMEQGMSAPELETLLGSMKGFDAGRARRVALDQVNKINTGVQTENALALGMNKGIWIHVPGQYESRHSHEDILNGREFDITQGMWDPEVRQYIMPAQLPYCRCIFRSVIPEELLQ